jgi:hypothetical protein
MNINIREYTGLLNDYENLEYILDIVINMKYSNI